MYKGSGTCTLVRVHEPLDDVIAGKTSVRVLRTLSLFPGKEFTGRQLAAMAGGAPSKVIGELERFKSMGLVTRKILGRTHVWRANSAHVLFSMLAPLFEAEHALPGKLRTSLEGAMKDPRIAHAILFGSFARGDEGPRSDLDLLVIVSRKHDVDEVRANLEGLAVHLDDAFGLRLSPIVHAERGLPALRKTALFAQIKEEGLALKGEIP
jgi:predicted nucleotidyltransferase